MSEPRSFLDGRVVLHAGDCRDVIRALPDASIDSCVTDPPYALVPIVKRFGRKGAAPAKGDVYARASAGFMGQGWDTGEVAFDPAFWAEVLRVLKPGAHLVAFGGTRSYHRLACAIEDAGFEIRDSIGDLFDVVPEVRAFVESLSASQLDAFLRIADIIGFAGVLAWAYGSGFPKSHALRAIDRPELGTALKPAWEPIVLARKPLIGTVADTVLAHGTGGLNILGCLIRFADPTDEVEAKSKNRHADFHSGPRDNAVFGADVRPRGEGGNYNPPGRWPANLVHDGSDGVVAAFPAEAGGGNPGRRRNGARPASVAKGAERDHETFGFGDSGSAARFFYSAKADANDRVGSKHPTIKPVDLLQWLCRLVTPPGGTVLDPFAGTGTTGEAAFREGFRAVLIEREADYLADIARRMDLTLAGPATRKSESTKARGRTAESAGPLFGGEGAATSREPSEAASDPIHSTQAMHEATE